MSPKLTPGWLLFAILLIWSLVYGLTVAIILTKPVPTIAVTSVGLVNSASGVGRGFLLSLPMREHSCPRRNLFSCGVPPWRCVAPCTEEHPSSRPLPQGQHLMAMAVRAETEHIFGGQSWLA